VSPRWLSWLRFDVRNSANKCRSACQGVARPTSASTTNDRPASRLLRLRGMTALPISIAFAILSAGAGLDNPAPISRSFAQERGARCARLLVSADRHPRWGHGRSSRVVHGLRCSAARASFPLRRWPFAWGGAAAAAISFGPWSRPIRECLVALPLPGRRSNPRSTVFRRPKPSVRPCPAGGVPPATNLVELLIVLRCGDIPTVTFRWGLEGFSRRASAGCLSPTERWSRAALET